MRTVEVIDAELQALAAYRRVSGCSVRVIDRLLDERLAFEQIHTEQIVFND
ncbi:hypothetical protein SEA_PURGAMENSTRIS_35 [Mycobacterium phage Purgamenstris]|uniref:Uncharacterized protein n=6 Tax=Charlievirus redi TaxID=2003505 RepID=A0A1I9SC86_9CAUD|nr:hypothetical protein CL59_gp35 [Mycobacterium phage Redi]AOZ64463.1 hypothetical protein SEA_PHANCYPHIN_35 [Mycobacterium phage PhancyPhin]QAY16018.1 hypothetical protein SEA_BABERUTH_36 [Mycobacterium phage BabeRuth]QBI99163.1 hypothetical protein SEA_NENAE_35 [Mycobacterium phage Nenae]QBI99233.1 hypothetical protein SEA_PURGAMENSTRIS_35 [Mycobacterium phage Purgamenstris]QBI99909.1 hypothetical protein SEA_SHRIMPFRIEDEGG_35 [Mycobacterium phage ShrimpFriedEgg]